MPLETASFIADLVLTNPDGATDAKSQGDDHLRLIKTAVQGSFPGFAGRFRRVQVKTGAYTAVLNDNSTVLRFTTAATLTLTAAATLGNGWEVIVYADGVAVTIDPNAAETINGAATLALAAGEQAHVWSDGTNVQASLAFNASLDGRYVNVSGDTMTGLLTLSADPASALHATTKQYTDLRVLRSGDTLTGQLLTQVIAPVTDNTYASGSASLRWSDMRSVQGTFTGSLSIGGSVVPTVDRGAVLGTTSLRFDEVWGHNVTVTGIATMQGTATITGLLTANGNITVNQNGNGTNTLYQKRATDASPTGNFISCDSAAAVSLFRVDITGTMQTGTVPTARLSGTLAAAQFPALTGDVTTTAGSLATTIAANAVQNSQLRQGIARSVVGVTGNATANVADIQGTANQVLRVNSAGTALSFQDLSTAQIDVFTGSGTWTKPTGATAVAAYIVGPGGGGGSGRRGAAGTARGGGGGGGGGGVSSGYWPATALSATETVTVGAVGTGGAAVATNDTDGANGVAGGTTTFGNLLKATGGSKGDGGTTSGGGGNSPSGVGFNGDGSAGAGGALGTGNSAATVKFVGGGAGGGGLNTSDVESNGGVGGGSTSVKTTGTGGIAGVANAVKGGGTGESMPTNAPYGGGGGGGGASESDGTTGAGNGGIGGNYGAGGGGGGASANGSTSGAGGNGGPSIVVVVTYF